MRKRFIQILLLCSLLFNIAHASVIAMEDECHHDSVHKYILEQSETAECGDLCDIHHLFHFMAIIETPLFTLQRAVSITLPIYKNTYYTPPSKQTEIKPPIV